MAYTLYLDKQEDFICEVEVKNANLKGAFARIIVESDDISLMFPGKIKDGKCQVPIKRLKGLLAEDSKGKMHLEVIVEDTYFKPWESDFAVQQHTDVKVKINEQKNPSKPIVQVTSVKGTKKLSEAAADLLFICEKVGIKKSNFGKRKNDFSQVIKEYFKTNPSYIRNSRKFIMEAVSALK